MMSLLAAACCPAPGRYLPSLKRILVLLIFLPGLIFLQAIHWVGFLVDEILFRGYRKVSIDKPLFILGIPRSGTTFLHRLFARDPQFTTFKTWHCLFAPSVTERMIFAGIARLDRWIGRPLDRTFKAIWGFLSSGMSDIHPLGLEAAEEDYFVFLPVFAFFPLVVPFPSAERLWRIARIDDELGASERRLLAYYRACLQKHLYFEGPDKRLLSKNAAFAGMAHSLVETFPDARVICLLRDPASVVPSQLSSISPAIRLFDADPDDAIFTPRFLDLLAYYNSNLRDAFPAGRSQSHATIQYSDLKSDLATEIRKACDVLAIALSPQFEAELEREANNTREYRSRHRYSLSDFGLDQQQVERAFAMAGERPADSRS